MLNESQRAAVERWGQDVCVVAGPGSGKTRVLIERFRWLVEQRQIAPRRVLAVTFTEKAATEIKKRLIEVFAASGSLREEIERAWVSTIHGFCTRLLKENAIAAGIDPEFRLLDEAASQLLLRRCADEALDHQLHAHKARMRELLYELDCGAQDVALGVMSLYEEARSAGVSIDAFTAPSPAAQHPWQSLVSSARLVLADPPNGTFRQREAHLKLHHWARQVLSLPVESDWKQQVALLDEMPRPSSLKTGTRARSVAQELRDTVIPAVQGELLLRARLSLYPLLIDALRAMHRDYVQRKRQQAVLDFEDLQESAIRLLETNAELKHKVRNSFDQVLMDELQDTNRLQWRLIDLVRKPDCLFAVGDINQSIYYFRHADPAVFRQYRDSLAEAGEQIDELRENYRSRSQLVDAFNAVSPYLMGGVEPHQLVARREYDPKPGPCVEFLHTFAERDTDDAVRTEAFWVARRIREIEGKMLVGKQGDQRPARFSDIAVLARTIASLGPIQEALDEFGVPCTVTGGRSFHEAREIRDLTAWLAVLANPRDEISLAIVLRSPLAGISDETLLLLAHRIGEDPQDLPSSIERMLVTNSITGVDGERLAWLWSLVKSQRARAEHLSPDMLLAQVVDESGYESGLPARARANIAKFLALVRERHLEQHPTLAELVEDLAHRRRTQSEPEAAAQESANSVHLMSVHAAKGLEYPIVFVAAMRNAGQNREPILCFDQQHVIGASWRHPAGGPGVSDPVHLAVCAARKRQEEGEEDRLLYVAMTRAEEHLIFTASPNGQGAWAKRVAEALQIPTGIPKAEHREIVHTLAGTSVDVVHTRVLAANDFPPLPSVATGEAVYLDPLPATGQYETTIPVTSVAQYTFCPRQYYLSRYLRWPAKQNSETAPPPEDERLDKGEWSASEFGVMVHEMLAGKTHPEASSEAEEMVAGFQSSPLGRRSRRASRIEHEFDFMVEIEGVIVRGQIDLWFEEGGEVLLVDYKSDLVEPGRERWHALRYGPQLRLYAIALECLLGRYPDRAILWYLRTREAVQVPLDAESLEKARQQVRALRDAQANVTFPLREGAHCLRCGYYHDSCPSAYEEVTLGLG
jgi:ATP-dependent exoDNAse (exonuclease V) beta subunit